MPFLILVFEGKLYSIPEFKEKNILIFSDSSVVSKGKYYKNIWKHSKIATEVRKKYGKFIWQNNANLMMYLAIFFF